MLGFKVQTLCILTVISVVAGCSRLYSRSPNDWQVACENAPAMVVLTLEDLGYQVTGRFDPSSKSQGVITGKRPAWRGKERVSVVLRCRQRGYFSGRRWVVEVLPRPIAWRPEKSGFPGQFKQRFGEYVSGTAKPMPRRQAPERKELVAQRLSRGETERNFGKDLSPAGVVVVKVEVRNLGDKPLLVSSELSRVVAEGGEAVVPLALREVSSRVARSRIGAGRDIYGRLEELALGHAQLPPAGERVGFLFFSGGVQGELVLPLVDAETGAVRKLSAPIVAAEPEP